MAAAALRRDPSLSPAVREDMEMIHRNVELETRLIDDLLDLTRVAHGKLALRSDRVNLADRVREVVRMVDAEAAARQVKVSVEADAGPAVVTGDAARLQQVVWNLLKNAIKFTPAGGRIRVSAAPAGDRARLSIADTGVGIDAAVLPHIFDAFEQGGDRVTRRFGGLGLGLSISRALIDLHGGTLTAASPGTGRGATFTVELPLAPAAAAGAAAPAPDTADAGRPLRLLLVEDHADTARVMARVLRTFGHDVWTADSVGTALETADAAAEAFDVVISDVGLPDGTGHDLMRQLLARFGRVRGIALTGYGTDDDVRRSGDAGFVAHLTKPVDVRELEETIARVARGEA
jgi:CheY-like chemotaxis protein